MEADPPFYPGQFRTTAPRAYRRSLAEGRLTDNDRSLIEEFLSERQATRQIGNQRVLKMRYHLITWRRFIARPYSEMTIGDVYAGLNALQTGVSSRGKPFKQNSKHDYIVVLKSFVLWLIANGYSTIPTGKIRDIRVPAVDHNTTTPAALLTPEEVKQLLCGCRSVRDRAIFAVLYESGARIGEVARLRCGPNARRRRSGRTGSPTRSRRSSATARRLGTGGCCPRTIGRVTWWTTGTPWSAASRGSAARRSIRPRSRPG